MNSATLAGARGAAGWGVANADVGMRVDKHVFEAGMTMIACPTVVTAHWQYPDGVQLVTSPVEVTLPQQVP